MGIDWIITAVDLYLKYMYTGNEHVGEVGKAPGTMFSATGWYYDADAVRQNMSISVMSGTPGNQEGTFDLYAPDYYVFTTPSVADMSTFDVRYYSAIAQLYSGNNFDWYVNYPGAWEQTYDVITFAMDVNTQQDSWRITAEGGGLPSVGGGGFTGMTLNSESSILTNSQSFIESAQRDWSGWKFIDLTAINPTEQYTYDDIMQIIVPAVQVYYPDISLTDFISESDILATESESEAETEMETNCCGCGNTYITVNADGSLTLNNDISGDFDLIIDNDADLSLNVTAAAGAFGAGAIVIDPDAVVNIMAGAGAFGAGAFGTGAIVSPNIDVSGNIDIGDISGEVSLNASDVNFDISGGDINIDQSGATNNNTYNTTNNYYYPTEDPQEPEQESFTINYGEILSEDELESILTQETYEIIDIETMSEVYLPETIPGDVSALPGEIVVTSNNIVNAGSQIITDSGLMSVYAPLALFSVACYILRGLR